MERASESSLSFDVSTTWDSKALDHPAIRFSIGREQNGSLPVTVTGPYFNSPPAPDAPQGSLPKLWNFEVAEIFFLGEFGKYLEVEFGPHGHYLLLLLNGEKNAIKQGLEIQYEVTLDKNSWTGRALLPVSYLPPNIQKVNAYAIHGVDGLNRMYEALYGVPTGKYTNPDFHRLKYFRDVNLRALLTTDNSELSPVWEEAMKNPTGCNQ